MKLRYFLYAILLLLPYVFRDYTPDNELRYISIIDEALENGSIFTFYNHGEVYADKPPLFFWLMMLSRTLFGAHIFWIYGLLCVLPAIGVIIVMNRWIQNEQPYSKHNPAGEMLLTTGIFLGATLVMRMDMMMTFFIVLSLYTFYRVYWRRSKPREKWLLPVYIFLAIFSKGPMGLLVPLVSILLYAAIQKGWKHLPRCFGWRQFAILLGLCAVWFGGIYWEGGKEYLQNLLVHQTVGRGINSFYHQEPFYFYLRTMPYTFAPWTITYIVLLWAGFRQKEFVSNLEKYFIAIILSSLAMLSLVSSKLDIYLLPVFPFVVYLSVLQFDKITHWNKWMKVAIMLPYIAFALLFPCSSLVFKYVPFPIEESLGILRLAMFLLMLCSLLSIYLTYRGLHRRAILCSAVGWLLFTGVGSFGITQLNPYFGIKMMGTTALETARTNKIEQFAYYKFRPGENLNIYLEQTPEKIESIAGIIDKANQTSYLLIVRDRERRRDSNLEVQIKNYQSLGRVGDYEFFNVPLIQKDGE